MGQLQRTTQRRVARTHVATTHDRALPLESQRWLRFRLTVTDEAPR